VSLGNLFLLVIIFALIWYILEELYDKLDNYF